MDCGCLRYLRTEGGKHQYDCKECTYYDIIPKCVYVQDQGVLNRAASDHATVHDKLRRDEKVKKPRGTPDGTVVRLRAQVRHHRAPPRRVPP